MSFLGPQPKKPTESEHWKEYNRSRLNKNRRRNRLKNYKETVKAFEWRNSIETGVIADGTSFHDRNEINCETGIVTSTDRVTVNQLCSYRTRSLQFRNNIINNQWRFWGLHFLGGAVGSIISAGAVGLHFSTHLLYITNGRKRTIIKLSPSLLRHLALYQNLQQVASFIMDLGAT